MFTGQTGSGTPTEQAEEGFIYEAGFGLFLLFLGVALTVLFALAGVKPILRSIQPQDGTTIFAIFFLMAQFIERIIEPFSEVDATSHLRRKKGSLHLFGDTKKIAALAKAPLSIWLNPEKTRRSISMWGLASLLGMVLCYATVGLYQVVGIQFLDLPFLSWSVTGHALDSILSGVVVGAGTKPLHDLIGYIQRAKG